MSELTYMGLKLDDPRWRFSTGFTLRDYFAAAAIAPMMAETPQSSAEKIAAWAYTMADAMIAERIK